MNPKVVEIERMVFEVQATTADDKRRVDLCDNKGVGACSCWSYAKSIHPAIKNLRPDFSKAEERLDQKFACQHVMLARQFVADKLIQEVIRQFNDNDQTT